MVSPELHHVDAGDPAPPDGPLYCDLCAGTVPPEDFCPETFDALDRVICQRCIEEMLEANACAVQP